MSEPRLLRALVIHDSKLPKNFLLTDDLDLFPIAGYRGAVSNYLNSWEDHLKHWSDIHSRWPERPLFPDIALIDCHFHVDKTAPKLGKGRVDPRGLLHGILLLAPLVGGNPSHPFACNIYSADIGRLKSDPYAITFFGFLMAMCGELRPFAEIDDKGLQSELQGEMENEIIGGAPSDAWRSTLLPDYREKLLNFIDRNLLALDMDSAREVIGEITNIMHKPQYKSRDDVSLQWISRSGEENVLLRSLFADCRERGGKWNPEKLKAAEAGAWCEALGQLDWRTDYNHARELLEHVVGVKMTNSKLKKFEEKLGKGKREADNRLNRVRGLAIIMWIAERLAKAKQTSLKRPTPTILEDVFAWDPQIISRAIQKIGRDPSLASEMLIDKIEKEPSWPLDPAAYLCARTYLKEKKIPEEFWPKSCRAMAL